MQSSKVHRLRQNTLQCVVMMGPSFPSTVVWTKREEGPSIDGVTANPAAEFT